MPVFPAILALAGCLGLQAIGTPDTGGSSTQDDTGPTTSNFGGMTFPEVVDFGQVELGVAETLDVVLVNDSDGNLTLGQVVLDLPTSYTADYTSVPWVIGAGGQYVISLTFLPTSSGVADGTLSFGIDGIDGLAQIPVTGEGVTEGGGDGGSADGGGGDGGGGDGGGGDGGGSTGDLFFSTTRLDFGTVNLGGSGTQNVTIRNDSDATVEISAISTSDPVVSTAGISAPADVSPGSTRTLQVTFSPTVETTYTESVTVQTSAGDQTIMVTGIGEYTCSICAPVIDVDTGGSATSMDFVSVLGIPDTQTVRIGNVGDEDLEVSSVSMTNDTVGGGTFAVTFGGATTVAPGASTTFTISYTCPDVVCLDTPNETFDWNRVHIRSNDPSNPDWVIGLNGI